MSAERSVSFGWRLVLRVLSTIPQGMISRIVGRLTDLPLPRPIRSPVLGILVSLLGIDLAEAELPLGEYKSFGDLFVRRLRADARPSPDSADLLASPVDGIVGTCGPIVAGLALQAKGRHYTVTEIVDDADRAEALMGGSFVTIYLSPRHYHRIHSPCAGRINAARHVPGHLFPVNLPAVNSVPNLFCRNERLISWVEGSFGPVAVVAVGAFNVGRISAAFDPEWTGRRGVTNRRGARAETHTYDPPVSIDQCDEIMAFHLGSTIVMLIPPVDGIGLAEELREGREIRVGEPVARRVVRSEE